MSTTLLIFWKSQFIECQSKKLLKTRNAKQKKNTYNEKWEDKEDITGNKIGLWCKRENDQTARCSLCNKIISVSTHGIAALRIHAKRKKTSGQYFK